MDKDNQWALEEDLKYSLLYEKGSPTTKFKPYPIGNPMGLVREFSYSNDLRACDLGCGRASLSNYFKEHYVGVDCSKYIIDLNKSRLKHDFYHASLCSLACLKDCEFDVSICADVMEHIPEEHVDEVLGEISTVKSNVYAFGISTRKSVFLDNNGGNLHLTVWDHEKWLAKLREYFDVIRSDHLNYEPPRSLLMVECKTKHKQQ